MLRLKTHVNDTFPKLKQQFTSSVIKINKFTSHTQSSSSHIHYLVHRHSCLKSPGKCILVLIKQQQATQWGRRMAQLWRSRGTEVISLSSESGDLAMKLMRKFNLCVTTVDLMAGFHVIGTREKSYWRPEAFIFGNTRGLTLNQYFIKGCIHHGWNICCDRLSWAPFQICFKMRILLYIE